MASNSPFHQQQHPPTANAAAALQPSSSSPSAVITPTFPTLHLHHHHHNHNHNHPASAAAAHDSSSPANSPLPQHATSGASSPQTPNQQWHEDLSSSTVLIDTRPSTALGGHDDYQDPEDDDDDDDQNPGGISLFGGVEGLGMGGATLESAADDFAPASLFSSLPLNALTLAESTLDMLPTDGLLLFGAETSAVGMPPSLFSAMGQFAPPDWNTVHYEQDDSDGGPTVQEGNPFPDICTFVRDHMPVPRDGVRRCLDFVPQPAHVTHEDVDGDRCDVQGINWEKVHLSRDWTRAQRNRFERERKLLQEKKNQLNGRPKPKTKKADKLPNTGDYFSFSRTSSKHRTHIAHFQLRNLITATSQNDVFYATRMKVMKTDVDGTAAVPAIDLSAEVFDGYKPQLTTLAASDEILIAGGFYGEYAMTHLQSEYGSAPTLGRATEEQNGITNHIHTFQSRGNGATQAAFCSNDKVLRVLDCYTNTFTLSYDYMKPINCSATSPNSRMRAVVGDFCETLITNAERGEPLQALHAHTDDVFACAWADDGIHLATAAQDSQIAIWDARNWREPLKVFETELRVSRSLRFSPVGGGPRVLLSAESDDFVSVIDAVTWERQQQLDFFGKIAGVAWVPDGSGFLVANSDPKFGGIMHWERGMNWGVDGFGAYENEGLEWGREEGMRGDGRVVRGGWESRRRRGLGLASLGWGEGGESESESVW